MGFVRFLLALSVLLAHAEIGPALVGGQSLAAPMFFLISGYLISSTLNGGRYATTREFYASRAVRIFPAYWLAASLMLLLRLVEQDRLVEFAALDGPSQIGFMASNIFIIGQDAASFATDNNRFLLLPQCWSLALEISFYALAPFIIPRPRLLVAILIGSMITRGIVAGAGLPADPWSYRFFPAEVGLFAAGALVQQFSRVAGRYLPSVVTIAFAALLILQPVLALPPAVLMALAGVALPWLASCRSPLVDRLGEISFPLYLIHWPVLLVAKTLLPAEAAPIATVAGSLVAALFLWLALRPLDRLRSKIGQRHPSRRSSPAPA
jgi:peptidoglycan/LPS O-acetylase OafA/YrhL